MLSTAILIFPLLMIVAACMDLFTMRIYNSISIALAVLFLPLALVGGMSLVEIGLHYSCGFFALCITFALFAFGKIGGGDAKLIASSSVWIGWDVLLDYFYVATLIGGLLALLILAARKVPLPLFLLRIQWIARLHEPKGQIPYGVALGIGGMLVYPQKRSIFCRR